MEVGPLLCGAAKRTQVRAMFDRIAPRYDALNRLVSAGLDRRWRRLALAAVDVGPADTVLDLACGTGDLMQLAAARGARSLGVDMALGMLRVARRRRVAGALAQGDAVALPVPDAWASVVSCGFALRNFVSLGPVLREMARVLAPGGRLTLLEVDRPEGRWVRAGHELWFERVVPWLGGILSDRAAYAYLPRSVAYLPPPRELGALLEQAGFEGIRRRRLLFGAAQLVTAVRRGSAT